MPKTDDFWWYITLSGPAGMEDALSSVAEDSGCIGSLTTSRGDSVDQRTEIVRSSLKGFELLVPRPDAQPVIPLVQHGQAVLDG